MTGSIDAESERFECRQLEAADGVREVGERVGPGVAVGRGVGKCADAERIYDKDEGSPSLLRHRPI